jgi:hypothetical protein
VLAVGVVEHLSATHRRAQVDEYWRVLAPGGHIAILDTPNRWFPLETHSVGLPLVQWLPAFIAYPYARVGRPLRNRAMRYKYFVADGAGWRNSTVAQCLPSTGRSAVLDVTEEAGYGLRYFRDLYIRDSGRPKTRGARVRRALLRPVSVVAGGLAAAGLSPSYALPYLNLLFRRAR